jgi:hypothetical protein
MTVVDTDAWTCPVCEETVRGSRRHRGHHRGIHARRHGTTRAELNPDGATRPQPARRELVIPPAPKIRRRTR